jgi:predicted alpha/beta hydrolase family esterase
MLTDDTVRPAFGHTGPTTRRRLLQMAGTVAAIAPLAALAESGSPQAATVKPGNGPPGVRRAILVPRFGGDATADWYSAASSELAGLGIKSQVVSLLPEATAPGIDETVSAIAKVAGDDPQEIAQTILIGHSVGSRALLAYLSRHGGHKTFAGLVSVAGWFTVDALSAYPALAPWVNLDLNFAAIASAAGPITVLLSDNDPFTADWRANAADWLGKLGATVHITHGAGHYMTTSPRPVLDMIQATSLRAEARKWTASIERGTDP